MWGLKTLDPVYISQEVVAVVHVAVSASAPLSPFGQVAGEVLPEADHAPVLAIIDPIERIRVGQGHLDRKHTYSLFLYYALYSHLFISYDNVLE